MVKPTSHADNITMSGGGLYSLATIGAKDVIDIATPRVLDAIDNLPASNSDAASACWHFSDMGCADGGTSLELWRQVVHHIRKQSDADIQIVYADQARNDFNALVQILHGLTQFESYLHESPNVHALESGSSFYLPILPANSLDLGFSATAMHWLSQKPCDIKNHVHMVGASGNDKQQFHVQAANDWQTILLARARELKPGGKLVLVNFCIDEQGRYLGNTGGVNMFNNFNQNWQQFVDDGVIDGNEYEAMTLPQYYNTVDEFTKPLLDEQSPVHQAGLRLVDIETRVVPCPFAEDFKKHGDAQKFATEYIPTIRSWNESTFLGGLSDKRDINERNEIIENYYNAYQQQVAESPDGHGMGYVHAYMTIEKMR
jgi:SAM-dependent methyltransferase